MAPLRTDKIIQLAKEKTAEKERTALDTIDELRKSGQKVTFYSVAKQAGLSKTFLYNNDSVRQVIENAREAPLAGSGAEQPTTTVNAEEIIASIQKLKTADPESFERICAVLSSETNTSSPKKKSRGK